MAFSTVDLAHTPPVVTLPRDYNMAVDLLERHDGDRTAVIDDDTRTRIVLLCTDDEYSRSATRRRRGARATQRCRRLPSGRSSWVLWATRASTTRHTTC